MQQTGIEAGAGSSAFDVEETINTVGEENSAVGYAGVGRYCTCGCTDAAGVAVGIPRQLDARHANEFNSVISLQIGDGVKAGNRAVAGNGKSEDIIAQATGQAVSACTARQSVISCATIHGVVAGQPAQGLVIGGANQVVIAAGAIDGRS